MTKFELKPTHKSVSVFQERVPKSAPSSIDPSLAEIAVEEIAVQHLLTQGCQSADST